MKRSEKKTKQKKTEKKKNYQDDDKKSAIKLILRLRSHISKKIHNKDNYKFGTDPTMEDQIRKTNNWIYKTIKSAQARHSGPVAQRLEALSLYGSRWALSEDSGFNSYPNRPEGYLVKTWSGIKQL